MGGIGRYLAALIMLLMVSCVDDRQLSMVADLGSDQWRDAVQFDISNEDTLSMRNILLFVRYKPAFERIDSLPLHVVTIAPDRVRAVEQLTIYFPRTSSDLWQRRLYGEAEYRRDVVFNQIGDYRVLIYPQQPTYNVESVGVIVK